MSEGWMSIVEYARRFNVSDMTVRRRIKTGKLPAELKDGKYFIRVQQPALPPPQGENQVRREPPSQPQERFTPYQAKNPERDHETAPRHFPRPDSSSPPPRDPVNNGAYRHNQPFYRRPQYSFPNHANSVVDATKLVEFCESMLDKLLEREELLKVRYQEETKHLREKLEFMDSSMKQKEGEINRLQQEIEDLEILIKMLDEKTTHNQKRDASP
ncbi:MAG: hypothetical protein HYW48_05740 [Deltaproteobacteria bacterium]|nr:hypothetical protein [Deltaproteobacteria bacterium]